jgi:8-oxo-dGTP pyrophosphatase MutT (NUDIX family)
MIARAVPRDSVEASAHARSDLSEDPGSRIDAMADDERERADGEAAPDGSKRRRRRKPSARRRARSATAGGEATADGGSGGSRERGVAVKTSSRRRSAGSRRSRRKPRRSSPRVPTRREISAGGVVYRRDGDDIEIVLASRRTRRGQLAWGLAKGGIEDDETMERAAIREVREETGLDAEIEASLGETRYFYVWEDQRIRKTVHFFLMRHLGGDVGDRDDEMEEVRWFPLDRALKRAAYRGEREVLERAAELLR